MRECYYCNKRGLFLKIDDSGRCPDCAAKETRRLEDVAREQARIEEIRNSEEWDRSKKFYYEICNAYNRTEKRTPDFTTHGGILGKTAKEIEELIEVNKYLAENLSHWSLYKYFAEIFHRDAIVSGVNVRHTLMGLETRERTFNISAEFDRIACRCEASVKTYQTALDLIKKGAAKMTDPNGEPIDAKKLRLVSISTEIRGLSYRKENVAKIAKKNGDYAMSKGYLVYQGMCEQKIWQETYPITKTVIVQEPENPHDPNAIKVVCNDVHVGYIPAYMCEDINKLINQNAVVTVTATIEGGKYKYIHMYGDDKSALERGEEPIDARIRLITVQQ